MTAPMVSLPVPSPEIHPDKLRWRVRRLTTIEELEALRPQWEALADNALEPNVFYEPWMMLPALRHFHQQLVFEVVTVVLEEDGDKRLVGLFPFALKRRSWRLSAKRTLLRYYYCGLCTPLLDREHAVGACRQLFAQLEQSGGVYDFPFINADGPVMRALRPLAEEPVELESTQRALLVPSGGADAYLQATFSAKKRKELRRQERRLAERGELGYDALRAGGDQVDRWLDEFLALEASGWKGRESTAFASATARSEYFRDICLAAHRRGRLELHALRLNGKPLAMLCLFAAADGFYAFRTAYDEAWARFSPGALLCIRHTCEIHERPGVRWIDSCAAPDSELDNRIWQQRTRLGGFRVALANRFAFALGETLRSHLGRAKALFAGGRIPS